MAVYLSSNLKVLRKKSRITQDGLGLALNIGRTSIANYEAGVSSPDYDTLVSIAKHFGISVDSFLTKDLSKPVSKDDDNPPLSVVNEDAFESYGQISRKPAQGNAPVNAHPIAHPKAKNVGFTPKIITVDSQGRENILYVPIVARAGYLTGYGDAEYLSSLTSFRMPGLQSGTYRMFEVSGPSMSPTINDKDAVICEYVERLENIRDGRVYVIVTKNDGIVVKRLLNRITERGKLVLKSDTIAHRSEFPTYQIEPSEVTEIWYAKLKFSADFSEPSELYHRLNDLEADVTEMKEIQRHLLAQSGLPAPSINPTEPKGKKKPTGK